MLSKVLAVVFLFGLVCCGPHAHKSRPESKEYIEHGSYVPRDNDHYKDGKHDYDFDHESILGSHDAAAEYDNLSPEESKKRLYSLALRMDADGDKFVDRTELIIWVLGSFKNLVEEEAMEELEDRDVDEDGKVTWDEHVAENYGIYDDDDIISQPNDKSYDLEMMENDKQLFLSADKNSDGVLDKYEYPAFSHPEEFKHMHQILYQTVMNKRDTDKDGLLSFEEFIADNHGHSPTHSTEHYAMEKERFEMEFDLDKNGKLSREEVLLWIIPNNLETAESEADHLIENSDSDKDGKLSIDEIVDHHEIFVGSEATDFGEQLQKPNRYIDEL